MRKAVFIFSWVILLFMTEIVLFHLFGRIFYPNLLLLLVIFIDLLLGIRYGIATAIFAGIIHDAVSISFFGIYIFSYLACAYFTIILKKYVYMAGSKASRLFLVAIMVLIYSLVQYILHLMLQPVSFFEVLQYVLLPQLITTLVIATITFDCLKKCALKFYVS